MSEMLQGGGSLPPMKQLSPLRLLMTVDLCAATATEICTARDIEVELDLLRRCFQVP